MTAKAGARKTSRASTLQAAKLPEREIMEHYKNFQLAGYVWAYWLDRVGEDEIRESIETLTKKMPLKKVYLENHRGLVDVPQVKMRVAKKVFEEYGIETAGGITTTVLEGERKSAILDSFCYTDPRHRERLLGVVRELAEVFDEIILDDYFFTSCRCEMCIKAKGSKSWAQYRTELMSEFSEEMVGLAHEINPGLKFVIKYPNWYESYQENGYDPKRQKDIFDGVYTGTESRTPFFNAQHLQSYMSYSNIRLFENTAPGRNGGGWIDPGGSAGNATVFVDQAEMTFLAGAKELALFNYEMMLRDTALAALLGEKLYRTDRIMGQAGTPVGVSAYEAFDGDGEDQFYNFLGMRGIPIEPQPFFNDKAPAVLLTQSSCIDKDVVKKGEKYVREGGTRGHAVQDERDVAGRHDGEGRAQLPDLHGRPVREGESVHLQCAGEFRGSLQASPGSYGEYREASHDRASALRLQPLQSQPDGIRQRTVRAPQLGYGRRSGEGHRSRKRLWQ